jgi:hypothetical protein
MNDDLAIPERPPPAYDPTFAASYPRQAKPIPHPERIQGPARTSDPGVRGIIIGLAIFTTAVWIVGAALLATVAWVGLPKLLHWLGGLP